MKLRVRTLSSVFAIVFLLSCAAPKAPKPESGNQAATTPSPPAALVSAEQAMAIALNELKKTASGYELRHPQYRASFLPSGMSFSPRNKGFSWNWSLKKAGVLNKSSLSEIALKNVTPAKVKPNVIAYDRGVIVERYLAKKNSVEQQFVIPRPLNLNKQDLEIVGAVNSASTFSKTDKGWIWRQGSGTVSLGDVYVFDANGTKIPAVMTASARSTRIVVNGKALDSAAFPVIIDPEIGVNDFRISDMGPDGNAAYDAVLPSVAYNSTNNEYLVVWHGDDNTGSVVEDEDEIWGQRINAETGAEVGTNDFRISSVGPDGNTGYYASMPVAAYNSNANEYLIVWYGNNDLGGMHAAETEIWGQRLNAESGAEIGADDFRISDMGPDNNAAYGIFPTLHPAEVIYNPTSNEYLVVWVGSDNSLAIGEYEVWGQRLNAETGAEIGNNDFRISDMGPDLNPGYITMGAAIAYNITNDEYLVAWAGMDNIAPLVVGELEIFGQRLDAQTGAEVGNNDFRISDMGPNGNTNYGAVGARIAYNNNNNEYLVVWSGDDNTGALVSGEEEVFGQRLNAQTGAEVGTNDFRISDMGPDGDTNFDASYPSLAYNPITREYLVVWDGDDNTTPLLDNENEIFAQRLNAETGAEVGDNDFRLSDAGPDGDANYDATGNALAYNAQNNEYLVLWDTDDDTGALLDDEFEVFGQRIAASEADLSVTVSSSLDPLIGGEPLTYTVQVGNAGPDTAYDLTLSVNLPSQVSFSSATGTDWSCSHSNGVVTCNLAFLTNGDAPLLTIIVDSEEGAAVTMSNTTTINASQSFDPSDSDNTEIENTLRDIDTDSDGTPNTTDTDDDNDGVTDAQEATDGSNPLDRGSFLQVLNSTLCSEWNGFLGGMWNIMEHVNLSNADRDVVSTLYDIGGAAQGMSLINVLAGAQTDLLCHAMTGWTLDSYGKVCSTTQGGSAGDIDGRMVYYKQVDDSYDFAFAMPFQNGVSGPQFVPFNTYQPSLDSADALNLVTNWIQLTNLETGSESGTLSYYGQTGDLLGSEFVTLAGEGRQDFSGHQFGANLVGTAVWEPASGAASFQMRNIRYYYSNTGTENRFDSAFQLEGRRGSGELLVVPLDTRNGSAILEVANTTAQSITVSVVIYDEDGTALSTNTNTIPAYGSQHIIADTILNGTLGSAAIDGSAVGSVLATAMHYGRTSTQGILYIYGIQAQEALGSVLRGSYNTFLNQNCDLVVSNALSTEQTVSVGMTRYDGTDVLTGETLTVPGNGTERFDLCAQGAVNNYGVATLQPTTANSIVAHVIRHGENDAYRFPTPVRQ